MDSVHNPFLETLRIPVRPSRYLHIYLILLHILSIFLPWFSALNIFYKCFISAIPFISAGYFLYKIKFVDKKTVVSELILNSEDHWQVKLNNDVCYTAILGTVAFVHPYLTVITLFYNHIRQSFIFTIDNIDSEDFRRLRVRLRFKAN